ncbi:M56 family metallopeptidase [Dyadobacter sp. CY261]|uniref:M56 family metallopeptidase n=1 Tax=Dyadobacter sp. CY261 TaxID=2907203 RepID=UPI001F2E0EC1|nr:M56 family metallopeptidase [Dyadobacter sp. CY261]MCF0070774.1 M56 family metallopeptidase [Dyadobacter sp. CY261]
MISYLIKCIICSGILIAMYHLVLEREKMFRFNRAYLLLSLAFALTVPFVSFEIPVEPVREVFQDNLPVLSGQNIPVTETTRSFTPQPQNQWLTLFPWLCYTAVSLVLLLRFMWNIRSILKLKSKCRTVLMGEANLVLVPGDIVSYTFLNNIFIAETSFDRRDTQNEIIAHELAHARQMHSLDVIGIELLTVFFWFNPFLYFYQRAIRLNHEFLADETVLSQYDNVKNYQLMLLNTAIRGKEVSLSSSFNYSITKKRLAMMTKIQDQNRQYFKQAAVVVLALGLTFVFSEKIYSQVQPEIKKTPKTAANKPIASKKLTNRGPGNGISAAELDEFNTAIQSHTRYVKNKRGRTDPMVTMEPKLEDRMYELFVKMSAEQQKVLIDSGITLFQMDIPVKQAPTPELFENWKKPTLYGVWINGKHVPNTELNKYKYSDIAEYWHSKLWGAAKKGRIYKYQLELMTNDYFDKTYEQRINNRVIITRVGWVGTKPATFRR